MLQKQRNKLIEKEIGFAVMRDRMSGEGELDEGSQKAQTSSYNKY